MKGLQEPGERTLLEWPLYSLSTTARAGDERSDSRSVRLRVLSGAIPDVTNCIGIPNV